MAVMARALILTSRTETSQMPRYYFLHPCYYG
jgi:hypothetical protein